MTTYQIDLTDEFGKVRADVAGHRPRIFAGGRALVELAPTAEFTHRGFEDGEGRSIVGVLVRPYQGAA